MLATLIQKYNKKSFPFKNERLTEIFFTLFTLRVVSFWNVAIHLKSYSTILNFEEIKALAVRAQLFKASLA